RWAEYEAQTTAFDNRPWKLHLFTALARYHESRGDDASAETAYRSALAVARSLYEEMHYPDDRWQFLTCQNRLVVDARMCSHRCCRPLEEIACLDIPPSPRELEERKRVRRLEARQQRLHVAAVLLASLGLPVRFALWGWRHGADQN